MIRGWGLLLLCLLPWYPQIGCCADGADQASLDVLVHAYPDFLLRHDGVSLYWRDGTVMPLSDGIESKPYEQMLTSASLIDQLRLSYPRGPLATPPPVNFDPGRFRNAAFFRKIYGDCRGGMAMHLTTITWLPQSWGRPLIVSGINGVAERLSRISQAIEALPVAVRRAAYPSAGTFVCRNVRDAGQPSMHAFGAAIDLNIEFADYWLWHARNSAGQLPYRNRMPPEIVEIFERNGFIWGGKWYHYDTMHFEYRPELLPDTVAQSR